VRAGSRWGIGGEEENGLHGITFEQERRDGPRLQEKGEMRYLQKAVEKVRPDSSLLVENKKEAARNEPL